MMLALVTIGGPINQRLATLVRVERLARFSRLARMAATTAWHLRFEPIPLVSSVTLTTISLLLVGLWAATVTGFTTIWTSAAVPALVGIVAVTFASIATKDHPSERGRLLVASLGPLLSGVTALLALMTYVGPLGIWYWFWISSFFRAALVTFALAALFWTVYVTAEVRGEDGWRGYAGGLLAASGVGVLSLTLLLPDSVTLFRSLDRPLNFAPATETMLFALQTYAGVRLDVSLESYAIGALLLTSACAVLFLRKLPQSN
jgi:hypothetical protein